MISHHCCTFNSFWTVVEFFSTDGSDVSGSGRSETSLFSCLSEFTDGLQQLSLTLRWRFVASVQNRCQSVFTLTAVGVDAGCVQGHKSSVMFPQEEAEPELSQWIWRPAWAGALWPSWFHSEAGTWRVCVCKYYIVCTYGAKWHDRFSAPAETLVSPEDSHHSTLM